ncbi:MAG TPA: O-antigen ligase family protein, partial [Bacillota bacterium]|nr:O-antigen ligase family protein [Bacillota bacterium]
NTVIIVMALIFIVTAVFLSSVKEPTQYRIEHLESEENSWIYKTVSLDDLKPSTRYSFGFDVMASIESPYSYGILIRSYNSVNEHTDILEYFEPTGAGFTRKNYEFATLPDTERIDIQLYNYESNSYTVYKNMEIRDSNNTTIKKIKNLKYIPSPIADRLTDINFKTRNASLRLHFMKDGLKIIRDYPIAGAGGGAWRNLYRQYQSIPYDTTEVHNFYVQYGTEVGIIGLAALMGLLTLIVISMIKSFKTDSQYSYVYFAAMLLFIHSMIDFNLSLAAVVYMLWMLIGIINSDKNTPHMKKSEHKYVGTLALVLSLIICFASSSIYYGMKLGSQGAIVYNRDKDEDKTIELYEKAIKFDRYNGIYRADLAQILNSKLKSTKDKKYYDGVLEQISMLNKYEPYNHKYTPTICNMYLALGMFKEASELADKKLHDEPLLTQSYNIKIDVNYQVANYYLKSDKAKEAEFYLLKVIEAKDELEDINAGYKDSLKLSENYIAKVKDVQRVLDLIKADAK